MVLGVFFPLTCTKFYTDLSVFLIVALVAVLEHILGILFTINNKTNAGQELRSWC